MDEHFFFVNQLPDCAQGRQPFSWPVSYPELFRHGAAFETRFVDTLHTMDDPALRDCAVIGGIYFMREGAMLSEAALTAQHIRKQGMRFADLPPAYRFFLEKDPSLLPWSQARNPYLTIKDPLPLHRLREFKATWRLRGMRALSATLFPERVLAGLSPMSLSYLDLHPGERIRFQYPEGMVRELPRPGQPGERGRETARLMARQVAMHSGLEPDLERLLEEALLRAALSIFPYVEGDLAAMRAIGNLPRRMLAGSGGPYASRLIGHEVLRREGEVDRFEHGAIPSVLLQVNEHLSYLELPVCSRFFMSTPQYARIARDNGALARNPGRMPCRIEGLRGDPSFRSAYHPRKQATAGKKTLLYVPTLYRGANQYSFPLMPDMLYLDWQLRLSEYLAGLGHELICQPHPEGILGGAQHPLARFRLPGNKVFEEIMARADVYLFDYFSSQTFLRALCTDRKVILFDLTGGLGMVPQVADAFSRRVCLFRPEVDAHNRPVLDRKRIARAIDEEGYDNGAFFHALFGGVHSGRAEAES